MTSSSPQPFTDSFKQLFKNQWQALFTHTSLQNITFRITLHAYIYTHTLTAKYVHNTCTGNALQIQVTWFTSICKWDILSAILSVVSVLKGYDSIVGVCEMSMMYGKISFEFLENRIWKVFLNKNRIWFSQSISIFFYLIMRNSVLKSSSPVWYIAS